MRLSIRTIRRQKKESKTCFVILAGRYMWTGSLTLPGLQLQAEGIGWYGQWRVEMCDSLAPARIPGSECVFSRVQSTEENVYNLLQIGLTINIEKHLHKYKPAHFILSKD